MSTFFGPSLRYFHLSLLRLETAATLTINQATYTWNSYPLEVPIDLERFPFTHYRLIGRGNSTEAAQTVTLQLDSGSTGAAPAGSGDDISFANASSNQDSGWKARTDGLAAFTYYKVLMKGSNTSVDLVLNKLDLLLRIGA